ncbi:MAG: hypothetical protein KatS3mg076_0130 [Candidatus Binatia bacterium]|nr:MAG: hypothetical protein KatS3mg076_0130 [Candidatus Binatia bacterium]
MRAMRLVLCGLLFLLAVGVPRLLPAQPTPAEETDLEEEDDRLITMDFQDVDLAVLVKFISDITGKNFIVDDRVKGKVTVISPSKISVDEAYAVFQSVLQVKGFTTVPSGVVTKIVPTREAKTTTIGTVMPDRPAVPTDEFITRLIPLKKVDANAMVSVIQPLVSPDGLLAAYTPTNTIILIDTAANTERLARLLGQLDVEGFERNIEVIRLVHAFADEIAAKVVEVLEGTEPESPAGGAAAAAATAAARARAARGRPGAQPSVAGAITGGSAARPFKIVPDERTNSLIVIAGPIEMRQIKEIVAKLDVPLPLGTGRIHVYYLKHANAEELVAVLADLIGGGGGGGFGGFGGLRGGLGGFGRLGGVRGGLGGRGLRGTSLGSRGRVGGFGLLGERDGFGTSAQRLGGAGTTTGGFTAPVSAVGGGAEGGAAQFQGEVRITADPATNALIINASPQDYETLKEVIEKLDIRRRQVYVEAVLLEVDLSTAQSLGFSFQGATDVPNGVGLGRFNLTQSALGGALSGVTGLAQGASVPGLLLAAASSQTIRLPDGSTIPAQMAILNAVQTDSTFNILSAPNILTTDNQEAEIVSGRNLPFIASRSTSETNLANTFATVERRDVGITLRITPQISEGGTVRLDIFQEVSDTTIEPSIDANLLGPATTIRSATTTVVARDGQTVVIGGLISDTVRSQETKVPFVGDIPVLGHLFNNQSRSRNKINLMLFLTPHIVRDEYDQERFSKIERGKMQAFLEEQDIPNKRRDVLERPSWDIENLPPVPKRGERLGREVGDGASAAAVPLPPKPAHFVLLATLWAQGEPPESLRTESGLLALELPELSELRFLFRRGERYRFETDRFRAVYYCLETFSTAGAAGALYPEGLRVSTSPREHLHWRPLQDASAKNVLSWTRLDG